MKKRSLSKRFVPVGVWIAALFVFVAIIGPYLAPHDPRSIDLSAEYASPNATHLFGATENGVDILSVILHGARLAGTIAFFVVGFSFVVGTMLGAIAGYFRGAVDQCISAAGDLIQAFPALLLNVAILALVASPGVMHVVFALSITHWVLYMRIARVLSMSLREREFVHAARALGASHKRIVARHIIPNVLGPLVVQATTGLGGVILAESTLSFLGLGPGVHASWGALLDQGSAVLLRFPHVALTAGAAIAISVLGFNLAGDWLRDRLDPRTIP